MSVIQPENHPTTHYVQFKTLLHKKGIYEAIRFINSKSVHRFTALYIFDKSLLRNICFVDKQNETIRSVDAINVTDSYCLYVRNSGQKFITPDSLDDERTQGHPKQATIQSYCGIPLMGAHGLLGTLCHFDFTPLEYTTEEVWLLEKITPTLVHWLETNLPLATEAETPDSL